MILGEGKSDFYGHNKNEKRRERKGKPFLPWSCFRFPVCSAAVRRHSAAVLVGGDHAYATAQRRACVDQEQPLRDAMRQTP